VRLAAGAQAHSMMTSTRAASNEKAKRELGWRPTHTLLESVGRKV
jgi:nucleoside-diphosphate-sugar epimerase